MVNSQEIIERSIYEALLAVTMKLGYTINPNDYAPANAENSARFQEDKRKIEEEKGRFIAIYGAGNNQSTDQKVTPRIVVNPRGFYPGDIGMPHKLIFEETGIGFTNSETPYETINQFVDIHLVSNNIDDARLLQQICFWSIPQRGYIKPYTYKKFRFSGNIFLELVNFQDIPNLNYGLIEKIYQFQVYDCLPDSFGGGEPISPILDISALLEPLNETIEASINNKN